jgi:hypothetical protein
MRCRLNGIPAYRLLALARDTMNVRRVIKWCADLPLRRPKQLRPVLFSFAISTFVLISAISTQADDAATNSLAALPRIPTGDQALKLLRSLNVASGFGRANPSSDTAASKAQLITLLERSLPPAKSTLSTPAPSPAASGTFAPRASWYLTSLQSAATKGVLSPSSFGSPMSPITREEAAFYAVRDAHASHVVLEEAGRAQRYPIADWDQVDVRYRDAVDAALSSGLMQAYRDNTFRPKQWLTRGDAAVVTVQLMRRAAGSERK